ncbi:potassium channel subfamily K member 1 isoform X1 [Octopus sinensis]|uniref:Potassium channel subfamily K member 1 n=1 Tax=Octopus sinensis TaxID=2607531 RepID=A0A7E6EX85_9MOLL|nr:potassium channel subfamily K member 1 isoform X1 [Octopus sinensis]
MKALWLSNTTPTQRLWGLVVFLILYWILGGAVWCILEYPLEKQSIQENLKFIMEFKRNHTCISEEELEGFINIIVTAANRGVFAAKNITIYEPNWSFGQSLFFATTVLTTIGYGRVTPLSDVGKGFCIIYALIGIPLTLIMFTALVERLMIPVTALLHWMLQKLGHLYRVFHIRMLHLMLVGIIIITLFFLIPSAIFSVLEPNWNYLDGFYYCFISLTTIGLGDYIPGDSPDQRYRAVYKVAITGYLIFGLIMMMLTLTVMYEIPELNLGFHFYLKSDHNQEEERAILRPADTPHGPKYTQQVDDDPNCQMRPEFTAVSAVDQSNLN